MGSRRDDTRAQRLCRAAAQTLEGWQTSWVFVQAGSQLREAMASCSKYYVQQLFSATIGSLVHSRYEVKQATVEASFGPPLTTAALLWNRHMPLATHLPALQTCCRSNAESNIGSI
jgi:hypothetical protein